MGRIQFTHLWLSVLIAPWLLLSGMMHAYDRANLAQTKAKELGFCKEYIKTSAFQLLTLHRLQTPSSVIRIYIEGDGKAFEHCDQLSSDPTPTQPVALELALVDDAPSVAYIARPGQFLAPHFPLCDSSYWSKRRFSPEVIEAFQEVIDSLKEKAKARSIELVGYSGGGALAVLIAAARSDVTILRTVAGNLASNALMTYHHVSLLDGSLDPLDHAEEVSHIFQWHFVGVNDKIIPLFIAQAFVQKTKTNAVIIPIEGVSHHDGWSQCWKQIVSSKFINIK